MNDRSAQDWDNWLEEMSRGEHPEAWRGIMCFLRWIQIREQNGHPVPWFLKGIEPDLYHSLLLRRLLDRKEPLEYPPPENFGQGWYELIETGRGIAKEVRPWEWAPESKIAVNQDIWTILERRNRDDYLITYRPGGETYRLTRINDEDWLLVRTEREPETTTHLEPEAEKASTEQPRTRG